MKICLTGPVYPNKGGIPQHTALLYNALKKKYTVDLISFKRYYPPFLYPGKVEKDVSKKTLPFTADRILDVLNPVNTYRAFLKIKKNCYDILILEWAVYQHAIVYLPLLYLVRTYTKTKIVPICHNVLPHKKSFLDKEITKWNLSYGHAYIVHSKKDFSDLQNFFQSPEIKLSFNPSFFDLFQTKKHSKKEARDILEIKQNRVILFFGMVREYKGLIYLLRAMPLILKKFDLLLLIAGEFWGEMEKKEIHRLNISKHIKIVDKYIPNEETGLYFSASDILVQPYITATQTAIAQIGYSFDLPVIATNVGGLPETVKHNETGILVEKMNHRALADAVITFYNRELGKSFAGNIENEKKRLTWENYVKDMEELF